MIRNLRRSRLLEKALLVVALRIKTTKTSKNRPPGTLPGGILRPANNRLTEKREQRAPYALLDRKRKIRYNQCVPIRFRADRIAALLTLDRIVCSFSGGETFETVFRKSNPFPYCAACSLLRSFRALQLRTNIWIQARTLSG